MNTLSKRDKTLKEIFIGNCWKYLHDNFHKFNETNKIKIALALAQKDMPTQMAGEMNINTLPKVSLDKDDMEYKFDAANGAGNVENSGEADADNN